MENMKRLLLSIYGKPLRTIAITIVLLVLVWRLLSWLCTRRGRLYGVWKNANAVLALGAVVVILLATLAERSGSGGEKIYPLFYSFQQAKKYPEIYRQMLMNIFLFVPAGLTLPFALEVGKNGDRSSGQIGRKRVKNAAISVVVLMLLSVAVEALQWRFGLGRAEVDDVLMNTLGALIGSLAYL